MTKGRPFSIYCIILFLCTEARKNNHILLQRGMYLSQKWSTAPFCPPVHRAARPYGLCVLYDTAARASEICSLRIEDVRFESPPHIRIMGKGMKVRAVPVLPATAKNEKTPQPMGCGGIETFWKQQEKVENSAEKLQNGAAGAGKRTPSRPTKKPNRLKMIGHFYKAHLENRLSTFLILRDTTKKKACGILYVTGSWCAWRDSNPRHLASENYDRTA